MDIKDQDKIFITGEFSEHNYEARVRKAKGKKMSLYFKDVYVIRYGSTKWGWKFERGVVQKLCDTKEDAIEAAKIQAIKHESKVFVENEKQLGTFTELKQKKGG